MCTCSVVFFVLLSLSSPRTDCVSLALPPSSCAYSYFLFPPFSLFFSQPWVGQCIGYWNYKYFFNFLLWLVIGTVYMMVVLRRERRNAADRIVAYPCFSLLLLKWMTYEPLFIPSEHQRVLMYPAEYWQGTEGELLPDFSSFASEGPIFFIFLLCATAFFAVGGMCLFHAFLIASNQTTIELYYNRQQKEMAKKRGEVRSREKEQRSSSEEKKKSLI